MAFGGSIAKEPLNPSQHEQRYSAGRDEKCDTHRGHYREHGGVPPDLSTTVGHPGVVAHPV